MRGGPTSSAWPRPSSDSRCTPSAALLPWTVAPEHLRVSTSLVESQVVPEGIGGLVRCGAAPHSPCDRTLSVVG